MELQTLLIFLIIAVVFLIIGYLVGKKISDHLWQDRIPDIRKLATEQSRAVLAGQFSEQLAPYLPDFPFSPSEAKFIGKPIDFIVFKGLDAKNTEEIVFVEVKSGKARTSSSEKHVKDAVEQKKVRWFEYRVPEELTRNKQKDL